MCVCVILRLEIETESHRGGQHRRLRSLLLLLLLFIFASCSPQPSSLRSVLVFFWFFLLLLLRWFRSRVRFVYFGPSRSGKVDFVPFGSFQGFTPANYEPTRPCKQKSHGLASRLFIGQRFGRPVAGSGRV